MSLSGSRFLSVFAFMLELSESNTVFRFRYDGHWEDDDDDDDADFGIKDDKTGLW